MGVDLTLFMDTLMDWPLGERKEFGPPAHIPPNYVHKMFRNIFLDDSADL